MNTKHYNSLWMVKASNDNSALRIGVQADGYFNDFVTISHLGFRGPDGKFILTDEQWAMARDIVKRHNEHILLQAIAAAAAALQVANKAYYDDTPSAETVGIKCVDLILAENKYNAAVAALETYRRNH